MADQPITRKNRAQGRGGKSSPGGFTVGCGCRFTRIAEAWLHVWPCRTHKLGGSLSDDQLAFLLEGDE